MGHSGGIGEPLPLADAQDWDTIEKPYWISYVLLLRKLCCSLMALVFRNMAAMLPKLAKRRCIHLHQNP